MELQQVDLSRDRPPMFEHSITMDRPDLQLFVTLDLFTVPSTPLTISIQQDSDSVLIHEDAPRAPSVQILPVGARWAGVLVLHHPCIQPAHNELKTDGVARPSTRLSVVDHGVVEMVLDFHGRRVHVHLPIGSHAPGGCCNACSLM
jgi:hypothetical protein